MAKTKNRRITICESELRRLLDEEHARGYKSGVGAGRSMERVTSSSASTVNRLHMLTVVADGCEALARLAKGVS